MAGAMHEDQALTTPHQGTHILTHCLEGNAFSATDFHDKHRTSFTSPGPTPDADRGNASRWFPPGPAYNSSPARRCPRPLSLDYPEHTSPPHDCYVGQSQNPHHRNSHH